MPPIMLHADLRQSAGAASRVARAALANALAARLAARWGRPVVVRDSAGPARLAGPALSPEAAAWLFADAADALAALRPGAREVG